MLKNKDFTMAFKKLQGGTVPLVLIPPDAYDLHPCVLLLYVIRLVNIAYGSN